MKHRILQTLPTTAVNTIDRGFTVLELLTALAVCSLMLAMVLPIIQSSREKSRQLACQENLRQIGIASHAHEAAHRTFPYTSTHFFESGPSPRILHPAISPHMSLLATLDSAVFGLLEFEKPGRDTYIISIDSPRTRPHSLSESNRQAMQAHLPVFLCPSDPNGLVGRNSYRANLGPTIYVMPPMLTDCGIQENESGAFSNAQAVAVSRFRDGLSNTAFFSERVIGDGNTDQYTPFTDYFSTLAFPCNDATGARTACQLSSRADPATHASYAGTTWLFGGFNQTWYNHVGGPNESIPDCSDGFSPYVVGGGIGMFSARSYHPGGVHVLFADGHVRFMNDVIDLDVWRAISTRSGQDENS